jgi:hypothetical protein
MGMDWTYHGGLWVAAGVLTEEEVLLAELLRYHGTHYDIVTQSQQCYELKCALEQPSSCTAMRRWTRGALVAFTLGLIQVYCWAELSLQFQDNSINISTPRVIVGGNN